MRDVVPEKEEFVDRLPLSRARIASDLAAAYVALGREEDADAERRRVKAAIEAAAKAEAVMDAGGGIEVDGGASGWSPYDYLNPTWASHMSKEYGSHLVRDSRDGDGDGDAAGRAREATLRAIAETEEVWDRSAAVYQLAFTDAYHGQTDAAAALVESQDDPYLRGNAAMGVAEGLLWAGVGSGGE